jgi:hypothetical protein
VFGAAAAVSAWIALQWIYVKVPGLRELSSVIESLFLSLEFEL